MMELNSSESVSNRHSAQSSKKFPSHIHAVTARGFELKVFFVHPGYGIEKNVIGHNLSYIYLNHIRNKKIKKDARRSFNIESILIQDNSKYMNIELKCSSPFWNLQLEEYLG